MHVARPEEFIAARSETSVVVLDATALWLKLRGEEKVYISEDEVASEEARKRLKKAYKKLDKTRAEDIREYERLRTEMENAHRGHEHPMVDHIATSAGDKYRVTLINISAVENWFNPSEPPKPRKKKHIARTLLKACQGALQVVRAKQRTIMGLFSHTRPRSELSQVCSHTLDRSPSYSRFVLTHSTAPRVILGSFSHTRPLKGFRDLFSWLVYRCERSTSKRGLGARMSSTRTPTASECPTREAMPLVKSFEHGSRP